MDNLNVANKNIKKNVTKTFNRVKKLSMPLKILVGFVLLLIIGLIIYFVYKAVKSALVGDEENPLLVPGAVDASDPASSVSVQLPKTSSSNSPNMAFTLSFWVYVADWYYRLGEPKAIMVKSIRGNIQTAAPGIWLAPNRNNLIITTAVLGSTKPQSCNIPNIPLQKWVHVAYVLDNRTTDVYINGKLERSCVLNNVPKLNNANLQILPKKGRNTGYLGQLSSVRYFSSALKPSDVVGIYQDGPYVTQNQQSTADKDSSGDDDDGSQCTVRTAKRLGELDQQAQQLTDDLSELQNDVMSETCPGSDRPCPTPQPPPPPPPGPYPPPPPGPYPPPSFKCPDGKKWCPASKSCINEEYSCNVNPPSLNCKDKGGECKYDSSLCMDDSECCGPQDINNLIWNDPKYSTDYPSCQSTWREKTNYYLNKGKSWNNSLKTGLHDSISMSPYDCPDVQGNKDSNWGAIYTDTYSTSYNNAVCPK